MVKQYRVRWRKHQYDVDRTTIWRSDLPAHERAWQALVNDGMIIIGQDVREIELTLPKWAQI